MACEHKERCSIPSVLEVLQIQTEMRNHYRLELPNFRAQAALNVSKVMEHLEFSFIAGGNAKCYSSLLVSYKTKNTLIL
jgi:hypothetical protein